MGETVLVTGGAGYIGSHTCKALAKAGFTPVTYDNLVSGHRWAVQWGPLEVGDIRDPLRLASVVKVYRPAAVIHFAAYAYVGESISEPAKYYRNNVAGSQVLLDVMRAQDVEQMVFSSSCATYGIPAKLPITEQTPQSPINPYGATKLMVERMLADYGAAYGLRSVALRYFNAAGADPDGDIGEDHEPETHLLPLVLEAAAGFRPDFTVFGDDYATPDGTCVRDYVHVCDLAQAHVLALQSLGAGQPSAIYNLGNGEGYSVARIVETARKVTGREIKVKQGMRRPGDPDSLVADATKARTELGWRPEFPAIEAMVGSAWDWLLRHRQRGSSL